MHLAIKIHRHGQQTLFFVAPSDVFQAGRDLSKDLVLKDGLVEPTHANFFYLMKTWWIEPATPTAVILRKGERIHEAIPVERNVELGIPPYTLIPDCDQPSRGTYASDGEITPLDDDPAAQPTSLAEDRRIEILLALRQASAQMRPGQALYASARTIRFLVPHSSSCCILRFLDEEFIPASANPTPTADFSFTLALRAAHRRKAFLWERSLASLESKRIDSLQEISSAVYSPMLQGSSLLGIVVVNNDRPNQGFTIQDQESVIEIGRTVAVILQNQDADTPTASSAFISYSRIDQQVARRIASRLRRDFVAVWLDDRLKAGDEWRRALQNAIHFSGVFILLMSDASISSEYVKWEIATAQSAGKPILPILLSECTDIPEELQKLQHLDLRKDFDNALDRLARRIQALALPEEGK